MKPIRKLDEIAIYLKKNKIKKRIAVACGEDANTLEAIAEATIENIVEPILIGSRQKIENLCDEMKIDYSNFIVIDIPEEIKATSEAVRMVKDGEADILMKGLVGTDKFLKAVLDKQKGLLPPKATMSYVCAIELPKYHKLLFVSDTAVLPFPDLNQKLAMIDYTIKMTKKFGVETPKIALIGASEKVSPNFENSMDYSIICKMADRGQIKDCVIDGPLDVFCACDQKSVEIKGIKTPIDGDADALIFPSLESCNSFYKGLMLFGEGELAGLIQGTTKPVVVMSRSESSKSKFYCVALSCLMAIETKGE